MRRMNVAIVTGTRAEFGIWGPVLRAVRGSGKLKLQLIVTGMHLQKQFGRTIGDIKKAGVPVAAEIEMYKKGDTAAASLARGTAGMAEAFLGLKSDLVFVLGDRLEMLAAASAALASQVPIAHLHGGETAPGQWDEQIRHAITKMAHVHFAATKTAARRIVAMGEPPRSVHVVGAPALDTAFAFLKTLPRASLARRRSSALLLLHPSCSNEGLEQDRTEVILRALNSAKLKVTAIGPNNDPGHAGILRAYKKHRVDLIMNLGQTAFWLLMSESGMLIGNSSAGIIEAATFGVPVLNVGERQNGRERNPNVLDVGWSGASGSLRNMMEFALADKVFRRKIGKRENLYGDGHSAARIVRILESVRLPIFTAKQFYDG